MNFEFDTRIDRSETGSLKWDKYGPDVLPLWVADMDFSSSPAILDALRDRVDHTVFGYTKPYSTVVDATVDYLKRVHDYEVDPDWLFWLPGLVPALNVLCRAFGETGDAVMTCTPVYPPFLTAPTNNGRELITSHLKQEGSRWTFDFDDMEAKITENTRVFILCNPHNPVGRVFNKRELQRLADFCNKHHLILCSDEIHCDLLFDHQKHLVTANAIPEIAERTVTLMAPSKTYNIPGLSCAFAIIPSARVRTQFARAASGFITEVNVFGYAGCAAAYNEGEPWRKEMITYLQGNRDYLSNYLKENIPQLEMTPMEATYLAWLNVEKLKAAGMENPHQAFLDAGVGLSPGRDFRDDRFVRLNFGCPRSILEEALGKMKGAVDALTS